jgi:IS1 family transposase
VYAKAKNVPESMKGAFGVGDVWTWVAIDPATKLVPSWAVGRRDGFTAAAFVRDLADRVSMRVHLTTDGHKVYLEAIEGTSGNAIDYAMLVKTYEGDSGAKAPAERRYSPPSARASPRSASRATLILITSAHRTSPRTLTEDGRGAIWRRSILTQLHKAALKRPRQQHCQYLKRPPQTHGCQQQQPPGVPATVREPMHVDDRANKCYGAQHEHEAEDRKRGTRKNNGCR